jgi:hypothetical protein
VLVVDLVAAFEPSEPVAGTEPSVTDTASWLAVLAIQ